MDIIKYMTGHFMNKPDVFPMFELFSNPTIRLSAVKQWRKYSRYEIYNWKFE
jgi:hypothetical protein